MATKKSRARTVVARPTKRLSRALVSRASTTARTAALQASSSATDSSSRQTTPPKCWPGEESFDDEDSDDFENDGTDDLPGLTPAPRGSRKKNNAKASADT